MDLFIGRLIALAGLVLGLIASVSELLNPSEENMSKLWMGMLALICLALTIILILSFFKKHFRGSYNDNWEKPEDLTHDDIEGLFPALKVNKIAEETTLKETLTEALKLQDEKVIAKFAGKDHQSVDALLVFSNQRVILYRTKSFGLAIVYKTVKNLIDKIPFLLWPIEGIEDAFKRVFGSEDRALRSTMNKATDQKLLDGEIPKWKCMYVHRYDDLKESTELIQVKNGGWFTRGVSFDLIPIKWSKAFKSTSFNYMYRKHYPELQAMVQLVASVIKDNVQSFELKDGKRVEIAL